MFPLEHCIDQQLRTVKGSMPTLIFPEAQDPRVISAVSELLMHAKIVLLASKESVAAIIEKESVSIRVKKERFFNSVRFIEPVKEKILLQEFAKEYVAKSTGKSWEVTLDQARKAVKSPVTFAILAVRCGYADAVLGGVLHSSRDFFQPCIRLLKRSGTVYEMGMFVLPDSHTQGFYKENLVMFADVALNPEPNAEKLADIAVGSCITMRNIIPVSVLPEINGAIVSYSTRGSGTGPSVTRIRQAEPLINARLKVLGEKNALYKSINITTELQIGCAISREAALTKIGDEAEYNASIGAANVLIAPNLDAGNLLYHIYATRYVDSKAVLIIGGLNNQALDFSRTSKTDDIVLGAKTLMLRMARSGKFNWTKNDYFFPRYKVLTINTTVASTEVGIWFGKDLGAKQRIKHDTKVIAKPPLDQLAYRLGEVQAFLKKHGEEKGPFDAVAARGGLLAPLVSGNYYINDAMITELQTESRGSHAVNLAALIASKIAGDCENVFVIDAVVVDEQDELASFVGLPGAKRTAVWHALAQKTVAKQYAISRGYEYDDLNFIVGNIGTGTSIGAHLKGRCIKVNNALFEGPVGLERTGSLPNDVVIDLCFSGLSKKEVIQKITRESGIGSILGTNDVSKIIQRSAQGDTQAKVAVGAMIEQVCESIAGLIPKFKGAPIEAVILTGHLTEYETIIDEIKTTLSPLGLKITVFAGTQELIGLRDGALGVLRGKDKVFSYPP